MKLFSLKNLFLLMCLSAPFIYLNIVYADLPAQLATHFGSDMKPDKYGDKNEMWTTLGIIMGVSLITYLIMTNIGKIDPKNQTLQSKAIMEKLGLTIVVFMSVLTIYIVYSAVQNESGNLLFILLGGLFAVLGNLLHSVKPNYFVGFRLPWTLESEDNWRKTHQLGGKVWVIGGLLIAILSLIVPVSQMFKVFITLIILMVIIPSIYSYKQYQKSV